MRETPPGLPRPWILTHGPERWHFGERPLVLGRLPDSDVVITDPEVSRIHAWLVPTPQGPVLVNRGQHGVQVNGEWVSTPRCLSAGDAITIGRATYCLEMGPPAESDAPRAARGFPKRLGSWVARYGPSEVLGTVTAVVVAVAMQRWTGSLVAAAYAAVLSETWAFYAVLYLRDCVAAAHRLGRQGRPFRPRECLEVGRGLVMEFGAAEVLDAALVRPCCLAVGLRWPGGSLGALTGKLAADLLFYGPVIAAHEWRRAHGTPPPQERQLRITDPQMPQP